MMGYSALNGYQAKVLIIIGNLERGQVRDKRVEK